MDPVSGFLVRVTLVMLYANTKSALIRCYVSVANVVLHEHQSGHSRILSSRSKNPNQESFCPFPTCHNAYFSASV